MAELKPKEEGGSAGAEAEKDHLKAAGGELLPEGRCGVRLKGWLVESRKLPILNSAGREQWEQKLGTSHLPEMVFGENSLHLLHEKSGLMLHFNAFDALKEWKKESLPPVEVPAAAKWKFRSNPSQQVVLDYDYTFTTPYRGSERIEPRVESVSDNSQCQIQWEDCNEQIDLTALATREPILFYDEVILYEDELADNGVSLLTVKVRVMETCWFLLLRFWLRVDGVLMRLRDTRIFCAFKDDENPVPVVLRENCWREATFRSLSLKGFPSDCASYSDPNQICQKLPIIAHRNQWLKIS